MQRSGRIEISSPTGEISGPYRTCVAYPDTGYVHIQAGPMSVEEAVVRGNALLCARDFAECRRAPSDKAAELQITAREANRELLFEVDRWKGVPSVRETSSTWELEAVDSREGATTYTFDRHSGLLFEKRRRGQRRRYEDWRAVGNILVPFRITDVIDGRPIIRVTLDSVTLVDNPSACVPVPL